MQFVEDENGLAQFRYTDMRQNRDIESAPPGQYPREEAPVDLNHIDINDLDLDHMTEEQLYAHMIRLQAELIRAGGNMEDL